MRPELPSGTVTFLFTDVERSTQLLHELGAEAYAAALAEHRRIVREACAAQAGVEVDTQGDAFFFAFPTAPGALVAASALTEALVEVPIRVRVGLHTGTPLLTQEGYVGDDVHRAARIGAAGHGGQVLVSTSTAALVADTLRDLGEHRFKDLTAPERVFQVGHGTFPPLMTLHQTNLPIPSTPFLGREREIAEVVELLAREDVRLLTLTGPGGTGKTRLALQAAGALSDRHPQGVWWVPLATLSDPDFVLESVSQQLGAKVDLASHIADKRMLVLFDNFEHVVEAASGLASLLEACPGLELLVTSREPLHIRGEQEYPVPPLAHDEAVGFFASRAGSIDPAFEVDDAVGQICKRLDELPLALELAAARVKALSPAQILERLERQLPLLTGGARDAPARQRTLRATIDWSYDLLSPEEQQLFARLAVFAGGCTLEAAEEVCDADLDIMQSLVEKSLLRFTDERYWMLETIREYAAGRLHATAGAAALQARYVAYFLELAHEAEPHLRADPRDWLDRLELENNNIRRALDYAGDAGDPAVYLGFVSAIWRFWLVRGYVDEGRRWLEGARAVAEALPLELRAEALLGDAELARVQGDYESARTHAFSALELGRTLGDSFITGSALNTLSNVAIGEGDLETASAVLGEAVQELRLADDRRALAIALSTRGYIALSRGDDERALELCEESFELAHEIGSDEGMALALLNVGFASLEAGRLDRTRSALCQSLELSAGLGFRDWIAYAEEGLAALCAARGRMIQALRLVASSAAVRAAIGARLDPVEQRMHDATLGTIRRSMSSREIDVAFEAASFETLEEGVAYALSSID